MTVSRVHYRDGQRLDAADLADEREYHRARRARHLLAPHRPGIVHGLQLEVDDGSLVLHPGVAVDPAGRLIVVSVRHDLATSITSLLQAADPSQRRVAVLLMAREPPARAVFRGRRQCAADDVGDRPDVCLILGDTTPPAGAVFVGAVTLTDGGAFDLLADAEPVFAKQLGGAVYAPRGDVDLYIGARNQSDPYHLALRVRDEATGATLDRLAIGRDGWTRLTGALHLLGGRARLDLATTDPATTLRLTARRPGPGGTAIAVKVVHEVVPQFRITLSSPALLQDEEFTGAPHEVVDKINVASALVTAEWLSATDPPDDARPHATSVSGPLVLATPFPALSLAAPLMPARAVSYCDDGGTSPLPRASGPALVFAGSGPALPSTDPRRLAYVRRPDDEGGGEELRLELGAPGENGDGRLRCDIGIPGSFTPLLSLSAGRRVRIHGGSPTVNEAKLVVRGQITQRPLPADPANALFKRLLVLASVSGFVSAGLALGETDPRLKLDTTKIPTRIPARSQWGYTVGVTSTAGAQLLWAVETLDKDAGTVPTPIFLQKVVASHPNAYPILVPHEQGWPDENTDVRLSLLVTAKLGAFSVFAKLANERTIHVVPEPLIDLSAVPDVVLPNAPWRVTVTFKNLCGDPIALDECTVAVGSVSRRYSLARPLGDDEELPFTTTDEFSAASDATVTVTLKFTIGTDGPFRTTAHAAVEARPHVDLKITGIPKQLTTGKAWKYDLVVKNVTSLEITKLDARQVLIDQDGNETKHDVLSVGPIAKGGKTDKETIKVEGPKAGVTKLRAILEVDYRQEGQPWKLMHEIGTFPVKPK
jgi:hypothetical protein